MKKTIKDNVLNCQKIHNKTIFYIKYGQILMSMEKIEKKLTNLKKNVENVIVL